MERISPVEASAKILKHLKDAWDDRHPEHHLENQEVVITIPASFDEVARSLTVESAHLAGIKNFTLLEEPQAAFYSWLHSHAKETQTFLDGDLVLVCDVGGGTTDFSLIGVKKIEGELSFQRTSVGDHLLLGGDNIDLTIAKMLEEKWDAMGQSELRQDEWQIFLHEARHIKETLFNDQISQKTITFTLQGRGSSIVKGSLSIEIDSLEIKERVLEGFFKKMPFNEAIQIKKRGGLRTLNLPFVEEPSITKHLAHFLVRQITPNQKITHVLFNGGTMKPKLFQNRVIESLISWFPEISPQILKPSSLDFAVSIGASYFGGVKQGKGLKIDAGAPRTTYLEMDIKGSDGKMCKKALTIIPKGVDDSFSSVIDHNFYIRANTPVTFQPLTSNTRLACALGSFADISPEEFHYLPPIHTRLKFGKESNEKLRVQAVCRLYDAWHSRYPIKIG